MYDTGRSKEKGKCYQDEPLGSSRCHNSVTHTHTHTHTQYVNTNTCKQIAAVRSVQYFSTFSHFQVSIFYVILKLVSPSVWLHESPNSTLPNFHRLLMQSKVLYLVRNRLLLILADSVYVSGYITYACFNNIQPTLSSDLFPSCFPTKILHALLINQWRPKHHRLSNCLKFLVRKSSFILFSLSFC
jgi:hypothetical protein